MEMQQGSMYYAIARAQNGWTTPSLDAEIAQEFNYIHSQMRPDGTVNPDTYLTNEPQYCYGTLMSSVALGYIYFSGAGANAPLATQCYNDLVLLFDRLRTVYPTVANLSDAGDMECFSTVSPTHGKPLRHQLMLQGHPRH
jgi:hypothetical protein